MNIDHRIKAFVDLGKFLKQFSSDEIKDESNSLNNFFYDEMQETIRKSKIYNPWFTDKNVRDSINAISQSMEESAFLEWISEYIREIKNDNHPKRIGVIMAGNIPMVGFHDMLCVLISGNKLVAKLSSEDKLLLPLIAKVLVQLEQEFASHIEFVEQLKNIDAVIATGSNNSARYFEYYFGKYPHIIRKNRNSVAVLTGSETSAQLEALGEDVFKYFGLGCRNVSKLFVPEGYSFDSFFESMFNYKEIVNNNKYANNYDYNKTVYLMSNNPTLLDNNFLLLKEDKSYASPIGVLFYEFYGDINALNKRLIEESESIQCILSSSNEIENAIPFGTSQKPKLGDYADGVDTMKFLLQSI
jgi:hypothetical protein